MEPAYRYIHKKLSENDLVESFESDYYSFKIKWKSGIRERWIIHRSYNPYTNIFNTPYRPLFLPPIMWPHEVSNDLQMKPIFVNDFDVLNGDLTNKGLYTKFLWQDFLKLGVYERLLFPHQLINFIIKEYDFNNISYSEDILSHSIKMVMDEPTSYFKYQNGYWILRNYTNKERPGFHFIEHFINPNHFGLRPFCKFSINKRKRFIYRMIYRIINRNKRMIKNGRKPRYNFDAWSFRHVSKDFRRTDPRPINYYRLILSEYGYSNIRFLDIEPRMAEKAIANCLENNKYAYVEAAPFDYAADNIAKYFNTDFEVFNDREIYDLSIIDGEFTYNHEYIRYVLDTYSKNVKNMLIFVAIDDRSRFIELVKSYDYLTFGKAGRYIRCNYEKGSNGLLMHIKQK